MQITDAYEGQYAPQLASTCCMELALSCSVRNTARTPAFAYHTNSSNTSSSPFNPCCTLPGQHTRVHIVQRLR